MSDIKVENLKQGQFIAENVISPLGGVLLYKGTPVLDYHKDMLKAFTINTVKITTNLKSLDAKPKTEIKKSSTTTDPTNTNISISGTTTPKSSTVQIDSDFDKQYEKATKVIKNVMLEIEYTRRVPLMEIRNAIKPLLEQICEKPNIIFSLGKLHINEDYTYQHSIGVGVLSALIAKFMDYKENELMQIGLAGTLHDIGKARIPDSILKKQGPLTTDEYKEIKNHPVYSYEFLKNVKGINQGVVLASLEHHERQDGKGYPFGRKAFEVHPYSKIVAVADVLHAMISNREYKSAENIYHVLKHIKEDAFGKLDPQVVTKLINNIFSYVVGKKVTLTNGKEGEIIFINSNEPLLPLIKIENEFIDLSRNTSVGIEMIETN